jgi:superoxide dismutase, Cu-Zn family
MIKHLPFRLLTASVAFSLTGCAALDGGGNSVGNLAKPIAVAPLKGQFGLDRGRVEIFRDGTGLRLEIVAREFQPGSYGMHIHAVGKCDAPDFASAGPHWNPAGVQHGADNPMGAHRGDLPNLKVEPGMIGRVTVTVPEGALTGEGGLLDSDGAAFVIHAQPDDLKTDPSGNSGGRIVCGVFARE